MNRLKNFLRNYPMRRIMNLTVIFLVFFILFSAPAGWGATYYVKAGGNDSLDGLSDATAWATIAKVKASVTSGDTVYFRSQDTWTSGISTNVVLTAIAGVTYDGSTYGTGTRAILKSTAACPGYPDYSTIKVRVNNVTIRGFEVDSNDQANTSGVHLGYIAGADISGLTITNCIVHNATSYGILVSNSDTHTTSNVSITDTTVYNCPNATGIDIYPSWNTNGNRADTVLVRNCISYNNLIGLSLVNYSSNVTVEYCTLYNNLGHGLLVRVSPEAGLNAISGPINAIVRYNLIYNNKRTGIYIYSPSDLPMTGDFYGNICYENGLSSVDCAELTISHGNTEEFGSGSTFSFYNNTFLSTTKSCSNSTRLVNLGLWQDLIGATVNFKNNILYSGNFPALFIDGSPTVNHSNNLFYTSANPSNLIRTETVNYSLSKVSTWEPSAQNTDPTFTGGALPRGFTGTYGTSMVPNTNYFAISSGNALNNGATLGSPYNGCINGAGLAIPIIRPQGAAYDIGAYEYVKSVNAPPNPPTGLHTK